MPRGKKTVKEEPKLDPLVDVDTEMLNAKELRELYSMLLEEKRSRQKKNEEPAPAVVESDIEQLTVTPKLVAKPPPSGKRKQDRITFADLK